MYDLYRLTPHNGTPLSYWAIGVADVAKFSATSEGELEEHLETGSSRAIWHRAEVKDIREAKVEYIGRFDTLEECRHKLSF